MSYLLKNGSESHTSPAQNKGPFGAFCFALAAKPGGGFASGIEARLS
jgi:hypothetical protein